MKTTDEILKKILLPDSNDWSIDEVTCDDSSEEIRVRLRYVKSDIVADGKHYPIYDHRPERDWRHLDMWQYKTIITARVPRYQKDGKTISVEVPWAMPDARISWLLEKNDRHFKSHKESDKDCQSPETIVFSGSWRNGTCCKTWHEQA